MSFYVYGKNISGACNLWDPTPVSSQHHLKPIVDMKKLSLLLFCLLFALAGLAQKREQRNVKDFTKVSFGVPGTCEVTQGNTFKVELEGDPDILEKIETRVEGNRLIIGTGDRWNNWRWNSNDRIRAFVTLPVVDGLSVGGSGSLIVKNKINADDLDLRVSGSGSLEATTDVKGRLGADVSGSGELNINGTAGSVDSDVSGSGKARVACTIRDRASFGISGSGKIEAEGTAREVRADISGSGKILAAGLVTDECEVRISGSGDVEIHVNKELDATISGSGSVSYKGNPQHVNSNASGSGSVRKM